MSVALSPRSDDPCVRVFVADPLPQRRYALCDVLSRQIGIRLVGQAVNLLVAALGAARHRPDVLVLGLEHPGDLSGRWLRRLRDLSPRTTAIVLLDRVTDEVRNELRGEGAAEVLASAVYPVELAAMVRSVSRFRTAADTGPRDPFLTRREREVLDGLVAGRDDREMAAELGIAPSTVRSYLRAVADKFGVATRREVVRRARDADLAGEAAAS